MRHRSWFQDLAYSFFANNNLCLVWSQLADIGTPPIVTSDFVYVRLIGDRSIQEKDFGRIQIDRIKEMKNIARNFKSYSNVGENMSGAKFSKLSPQTITMQASVLAPLIFLGNC